MADEDRAPDLPSHGLGFFGLVALLERLTPNAVPVGQEGPPTGEAIRFRHDPSLTFSSRDVSNVVLREYQDPLDSFETPHRVYEVTTTFLGLTGAVAPIPSYLAEEVLQEDSDKSLRRDFLDIFHHRLVSLLYRELIRFRLWGEQTGDLRDRWACRLMALAGFDVYDEPLKLRIEVSRLLKLAPLLAQQSRTAGALKIALEEVLADQLDGAEIIVREFAGSWTEIETDSQTRLGERNSELGRTALLGRLAFDRAGSLEIQIGPVARRTYERFLPAGDLMPVLHDALSLFLRDPLDHRVILELAKNEAPRLCLVSGGNERLGRNTWLGAQAGKTLITVYPYARENRPAESIAPSSAGYYSPPPSRGVARAG